MRWLDEIVAIGEDNIVARVVIRQDALLHEADRGMPAWVGIEYMAQAANAYSGFEDRLQGRIPRVGLLLGCRRYLCDRAYFATGAMLNVWAKIQLRDENDLVAFDCRIELDGVQIATADLKAIRPHDLGPIIARSSGADRSPT